MNQFAIAEVDDGLTVVRVMQNESPEEAALREGGRLMDPGPYLDYQDACNALNDMEWEEELYEHE